MFWEDVALKKLSLLVLMFVVCHCQCVMAEVPFQQLSQLGLVGAEDIQINGNVAYCATKMGLDILDVSVPADPVLVSQCYVEGLREPNVFVQGDFAYICDRYNGDICIVNLEDKNSPTLCGRADASNGMDIVVFGEMAFVAAPWNGIQVFDVSDKTAPVLVQTIEPAENVYDMCLEGNLLVAAEYEHVEIYSLEDPTNIQLLGMVEIEGLGETVCVHEGYAYVGCLGKGIHVINLASVEAPVVELTYTSGGAYSALDIEANGDYIYYKWSTDYAHNSIQALDVSSPAAPVLITNDLDAFSLQKTICLCPPYLYCTGPNDGLLLFDFSDPANPSQLPVDLHYELDGNVEFWNGYVFVKKNQRVDILDARSEASLEYIGALTVDFTIFDMDVDSGRLALTIRDTDQFALYDITEPASPVYLGISPDLDLDIQTQLYQVCISGDYAYLALTRLYVFDVSGSEPPALLGSTYWNNSNRAKNMIVDGDYAYVATESRGLQILDVSDSAAPVLVSELIVDALSYGVQKQGDFVFLTNFNSASHAEGKGLHIIDVSSPESPALVASWETPGDALDVAVSGSTAYIADGDEGIHVLDVSDPSDPLFIRTFCPVGSVFVSLALTDDKAYISDSTWGCVRVVDLYQRSNAPTTSIQFGTSSDTVEITPWIINPHDLPVDVTLAWRNAAGSALSEEKYTLPSLGKMSIASTSEKYKLPDAASVEIGSSRSVVTYHEISGDMCRMIAGVQNSDSTNLLLPHIAEKVDFWNTMTVVSNRTGTELLFTMGDDVTTDVSPTHLLTHNVEELLGGTGTAAAWGEYESVPSNRFDTNEVLSGYELFVKEGSDGAGVELPSQGSTLIYIPHIPDNVAVFWTGITMVNPNDVAVDVSIEFFQDDGTQLETSQFQIEPRTKTKGLMDDLFPEVSGEASWGIIQSDLPIIALELYGTYNAGICGYGLPYELKTNLVLPAIEMEPGNWTGIALTNPGEETATVTLELRSGQGDLKSSWSGEIGARSRIKDVVQNYFTDVSFEKSDYIAISSSVPITATEVAGSDDRSYMEAIAGML